MLFNCITQNLIQSVAIVVALMKVLEKKNLQISYCLLNFKMWIKIGFLIIFEIFQLTQALILNHYGSCVSPRNDSGLCVHLSDCNYLLEMLNSEKLEYADRDYLRQSQCGYDNTQTDIERRTLVCCPDKYCKDSELDPNRLQAGNVLPEAGICGFVFNDRILGGKRTKPYEFPWMALIQYKKPQNKLEFICGGSLINSRYVMTAAHCLAKVPPTWQLTSVRLGEWDLETNPDCETDLSGRKHCVAPHFDVGVENYIVHDKYQADSPNHYNDIALIRLNSSVKFTDYIKPLCLPLAPELDRSFHGVPLDVAGWGATENSKSSRYKLMTTLMEWDVKECNKRYLTQNVSVNGSIQLCAGGEDGVDSCGGDSGGPLMIIERLGMRDIYFAVGIVAQGTTPCGLRGWPGIYTRVATYMPWIKAHLKA